MNTIISIVVTIILTIANGVFSMSEMALSTAKKVLLDTRPRTGAGAPRGRRRS